jgi:ABC-type multidrug transport system fused ATPase/permease subunit
MDRIFEVFDTFPDVQERTPAAALPRTRGELNFQDVSFHYDGREPVLEHLDLTIPSGTTVALIGPSGAGKSTLVKLLPRFYDVTGGEILLDGVDIRQATLKSLREQIAIVSQEPLLFSGTITENLRFGRPDAAEILIQAAAHAGRLLPGVLQQAAEPERLVRLAGAGRQRLLPTVPEAGPALTAHH